VVVTKKNPQARVRALGVAFSVVSTVRLLSRAIRGVGDGMSLGFGTQKGRLRFLVQGRSLSFFVSAPLLMPQSLVDSVDNPDITRGHPSVVVPRLTTAA
jgi:hypothetical protein